MEKFSKIRDRIKERIINADAFEVMRIESHLEDDLIKEYANKYQYQYPVIRHSDKNLICTLEEYLIKELSLYHECQNNQPYGKELEESSQYTIFVLFR